MIKPSNRLNRISEYYFSKKLREVRELIDQGKDVINLGIGSPDLKPPKLSIKNLIYALDEKNAHKYQSYNGIKSFREEISGFYKSYFDVNLNPENEILPLMGSKEGIFHVSMSFLDKNDKVLVPNPGYPTYSAIANLLGNDIIYYNLREKNNWLPNIDELSKLDLSNVKIMWINYPHMPTGANASISFFEELISFAKTNNILLINDNPYSFILNDDPISLLNIKGAKETCIELNSLSKSFNMAGWRIGFAISNKSFISNLLKVKSNMDSGMFYPLQVGAISALNQSNDWLLSLNNIYTLRRKLVWKLADKLGCSYSKNSSGLFVWAKINQNINSIDFINNLLEKHQIFVTPGSIFGSNGEGYIRLSLCSNEQEIIKAIERL
ncbi:MAG: aminotransferase [Flavobacteriaceae bacterium]|nr:aminotransferase [Flavobacteriaceae bacterium]|tara:strand:- start:39594 stop:40736 length:1143 start_codon:yes stop_codon:yes gene_type:complete